MLFPNKLKPGDTVRVVAPSRSLAIISKPIRALAQQRFSELGLTLTFSQHCEVIDNFNSSSIEQRVDDLHQAFLDPEVQGVFSVIGGYNSNQLLDYLDYSIIKNNPKVLCGYSDITALSNAIYQKTGLINYSGPAYSTLGMKYGLEPTLYYLKKCLFSSAPYAFVNASQWSDDQWYLDQEDRDFIDDTGIEVINHGVANGTVIGGNLCTLNLLQGTQYMPCLTDKLLFIEDDELTFPEEFDRNLQSLLQLPDVNGLRALVIGRFQKRSNISMEVLKNILATKAPLRSIPVLANVSFGHTSPIMCFPIGGKAVINTRKAESIIISEH